MFTVPINVIGFFPKNCCQSKPYAQLEPKEDLQHLTQTLEHKGWK